MDAVRECGQYPTTKEASTACSAALPPGYALLFGRAQLTTGPAEPAVTEAELELI